MRRKCRWVGDQLQLYVDGRLEPRRLSALEAHLDDCSECRAALAAYEIVAQSAGMPEGAPESAQLTAMIMGRIAAYEAQRREVVTRQFTPRWADALLAALLATMSTLVFALFDPGLRDTLIHTFPLAVTVLGAPGPGAIAWSAWAVWIVSGLGLTFWLAGTDVRADWRRRFAARLEQVQWPQWPTLRGV
jgi:predicted anti-sigma-YlaC factor YlaD